MARTATLAGAHAVKSTNVRTIEGRMTALLRGMARVWPAGAAGLARRLFFLRPPRRRPTADELPVLAAGRPATVDTSVGRLAVWSWGEADAPTVVLVHGWGGNGSQLAAFVAPLVASGLQVLAVDLPGHGRAAGWIASLPQWAKALGEMVRTITGGATVHALVAHSLGATAAVLALDHGLAAERVVLLAPADEPGRYFDGFVGGVIGRGPLLGATARATETWLGVPFAAVSVPGMAPRQRASLLLVHDAGDRETPLAGGMAIARAWPGAEVVITEGLGHRRLLRDPEVVERVARFVAAGLPAAARCVTPGCERAAEPASTVGSAVMPGGEAPRCTTCAIEHELAHPHLRWVNERAA